MSRIKHSDSLMRAAQDWVNQHGQADKLIFHEPSRLPVAADYIWDKQRGGLRTYPARFLFSVFLPESSAVLEEYLSAVSDD